MAQQRLEQVRAALVASASLKSQQALERLAQWSGATLQQDGSADESPSGGQQIAISVANGWQLRAPQPRFPPRMPCARLLVVYRSPAR
jgi:hypothetical protein